MPPNPHRAAHVLPAMIGGMHHSVDIERPPTHHPVGDGCAAGRGGAPRFHKLNFLMFDGHDDPLPWLNRCEQFFRGQHTMEEDKVWLATFHMTGSAQLWYHRLERDMGTPSWRHFVELINTRFGPPLRSNPLGELIALHKKGTVREFSDQFLALLCRTDPLTERQQIQLFTASLGQPLQTDVEL